MQTIGERLRLLRGIKTQCTVAEESGVGRNALSAIERDRNEPIAKTIIALAKYYGVTTDYILLGEGDDITTRDYVNELVRLGIKLEARVAALEEILEVE